MKNIIKIALSLLFIFFTPLSMVLGKEVIIGGDNIGIELDFEGVLISGTYDVKVGNSIYNPSKNDIKKGDYIQKVNATAVDGSKDLIEYFTSLDKSQEVSLTLNRDGKLIKRNLYVYKDNHTWKTGLMIKGHPFLADALFILII
jgi:stage IV sporulation protein B